MLRNLRSALEIFNVKCAKLLTLRLHDLTIFINKVRNGQRLAGLDSVLSETLKTLQLNLADIGTILSSAAPVLPNCSNLGSGNTAANKLSQLLRQFWRNVLQLALVCASTAHLSVSLDDLTLLAHHIVQQSSNVLYKVADGAADSVVGELLEELEQLLCTELGFVSEDIVHVRMLSRISDPACISRLQFLLQHISDLATRRFSCLNSARSSSIVIISEAKNSEIPDKKG